jgi:hypothetical protein
MTEETRETGETGTERQTVTDARQEAGRQTVTDARREAGRQTMADVSHTNPTTGETFGTVYRRGPAVTDGGAADARGTDADPASEDDETDEREPMRKVDHTPRDGDGANEVWERGEEDVPDDAGDGDE